MTADETGVQSPRRGRINGLWGRMQRARQRRMARWLARRPFRILDGPALISFTFDDFPRSSLVTGGGILERAGLAGTYYAALGLMRQQTPSGEIFHPEDIAGLLERGHELGCHTFDHCPAWDTAPAAFEASVIHNAAALRQLAPAARFRTHSYPISWPRPTSKRKLARLFDCCRGGGQRFNAGTVDRNYLAAFFIEQSRSRPEAIREMIAENRRAHGWLILATHDVGANPTPFGCTPELLARIVEWAVESGSRILPVSKAWDELTARRNPAT
jgi:peptidoglycan/xylan/chitin deacetylase (PgdA/CDA1 family)